MAEEEEGPTVEILNETYGFLEPRLLKKITFPPGICSEAEYDLPYVVLAATDGTLNIEVEGEEAYDLPLLAGDHYARLIPERSTSIKVKVCNYTDFPIIIFKA